MRQPGNRRRGSGGWLLPLTIAALLVGGVGVLVLGRGADPLPIATEGSAGTVPAEGEPMVQVNVPASLSPEAQMGKRAFDAFCARCHGENAAGRQGIAPPLVHRYYEPGHHGDQAFLLAARQGVRAHHWPFGDMPPVSGVTDAEVKAIVAYIRELQRANGIR
ncbi:MAG: cytochrome c [Alphaproteobacteria bacterium]|nr:MAG: cytochrome c [Alphaproteobacteria bacterium]